MSTTHQDLRPPHPVSQLTTSELAEFRSDLEHALGLETLPSFYASREELQKRLDDALAEQAERQRIRHANAT